MRRIATDTLRALVVAVLCAVLVGCAWEQPSSSFDNLDGAVESGMVAAGWLPAWIPSSATRLKERHDIDTNAVILRFEFDMSIGSPAFFKGCKIVSAKRVESPRLDAWWWPENEALLSMPHLYQCADDSAYLAIPAEGGVAYVWSNSA